ncbi:ABC transporter substrate-binding protein [Variovorax robiniae]|uniref:ABC transporter substrate-binding protein n=1 Tax=Variovorax robiniae TaxID=1836199 RepID=A0ABU8X661_9BURK
MPSVKPTLAWIARCAWLALCAAASATAQVPDPAVRRIGFLGMDSAMQAPNLRSFLEGMREQGFVEGTNLHIDYRWAEGDFGALPRLAVELAALKPEVLVTAAPPAVRAAQRATTTIPIVMAVHDPVGMGFAGSFAQPGGNITGVAFQDLELSAKRLDLLRGIVPDMKRVALVWNRAGGGSNTVQTVRDAATALGMEAKDFEITGPVDLVAAVGSAKAWGAQGIMQLASPVITFNRKAFLDALAANRMPATCEMRRYVVEGCLMTYGASLTAHFHALAEPTARILRGARPAEMPIEQPRNFEFVVNVTTVANLGLTLPSWVLLEMTEGVR